MRWPFSKSIRVTPRTYPATGTSVERAPCSEEGYHTSYMIVPNGPGHVTPFPESNFLLTTEDHQAQVRKFLADQGFTLDLMMKNSSR